MNSATMVRERDKEGEEDLVRTILELRIDRDLVVIVDMIMCRMDWNLVENRRDWKTAIRRFSSAARRMMVGVVDSL